MHRLRIRSIIVIAVCCALTLMSVGHAHAATPRERLRDALATGDLDSAHDALSELIAADPDAPLPRYNLACIRAGLGRADDAVASLSEAFRLGFDDVRLARADPDLAPLRDRDDFRGLLEATTSELARVAAARSLDLRWGRHTSLPLRAPDGSPASRFTATVRVDTDGWTFRIAAPASAVPQSPVPWYRGGGFVVTIAAPDSAAAWDAVRAWRFGFGRTSGLDTGAVLSLPGRQVDTMVLDLAPTIEWDAREGVRVMTATIPWDHLAPYAPPRDLDWGLNLRYVPARTDDAFPAAMLVPDPAAGRPAPRARRIVPARIGLHEGTPPLFHGEPAGTIVGSRPLAIDLTAWSPTAGAAVLRTQIQDLEGTSLITAGVTTDTVAVAAGRNDWRRLADLSALPMGPYRLVSSLTYADGTAFIWGAGLFRFQDSWLHRTLERTKPMRPAEAVSVQWRLDLISSELAVRDPRASAASLITTVAETERLLGDHDARATIVPAEGTLQAAAPAAGGRLIPVLVHAPPGGGLPVDALLLARRVGDDDRAVRLLTAGAAADDMLTAEVVLGDRDGPTVADLPAIVDWLRDLVPGARVIAAVHDDAAAVLDAPGGRSRPDAVVEMASDAATTAALVRAAAGR